MSAPGVPLHEAPRLFFDQDMWNKLVRLVGTHQRALEHISIPALGYFAHESNAPPPEVTLANSLVEQFKTRLAKGEIVAAGYVSKLLRRIEIPPDHWSQLQPNFAEDEVFGSGSKFTHVHVSRPDDLRASPDQLEECIAWMRQRQAMGESRRKVLEGEAIKQFGTALTTRMFDTAYKAIFHKPRGRPRKTLPK
jgi:hypothetical protein